MVLRKLHGFALVLCVVLAVGAGAAPKETHKLGVAAIEAGKWADAERFFRAAIAERAQEKYNRLLKTAYLPHYYLGVALAEQGKCAAALDALAESNRQAQIHKSDLGADMSRRREACQQHLKQVEAAEAEVEQLLIRVGEASASLATLSKTPELAPLWSQGDPSFDSRQKSAEKTLADARRSFGASNGDLDRLDQTRVLADSALSDLGAVLTDARQRLGELNAEAAAALEELEEVEQSARRALRSVSSLAPYPKRLGARVAAVDSTLKEILESKSGSSAQRLDELRSELNTALRSLRSAARRPPKELIQAVEAFLGGSYEEALALLDVQALVDNERTKPHVCLIRAASGHAMWILGGEQDDTLRDLAAESILACVDGDPAEDTDEPPAEPRSLESSLPLSSKFFSPRFVAFHDATLAAYAQSLEHGGNGEEEGSTAIGTISVEQLATDDSNVSETTDHPADSQGDG